jgi:hypothetical protein
MLFSSTNSFWVTRRFIGKPVKCQLEPTQFPFPGAPGIGCPAPRSRRFRAVIHPFIDGLLSVFHRFPPFLPFSEKRTGRVPTPRRNGLGNIGLRLPTGTVGLWANGIARVA